MFKAFQSGYEFVVKQLNDKNYKRLVLVLIAVLLVVIYLAVEKLNKIDSKLDVLARNDTIIENRLNDKINNMFIGGTDIFKTYAEGSTSDLKTIVDFTVSSTSQAALIKKLLEKNLEKVTQLSQIQQFKNKYIDTIKHGISVKKISFMPSFLADSLLITSLTK
jgi:hypothetical protein